MAKVKNSFEQMAKDAAARLDKVHAAGKQLTFLPDEDGSASDVLEGKAPGRPKGAKGKVNNQMRDWLAGQGYKMPEDVLAQMAGLASHGDAMMAAMENAELVLAWAYDGATAPKKGGGVQAVKPTGSQRLNTFVQLYTIQLRAADALLPYGAPKASPDGPQEKIIPIMVPAMPTVSDPAASARDVTPQPAKISGRMVPADVAWESEQNQEVSNSDAEKSDAESRTK